MRLRNTINWICFISMLLTGCSTAEHFEPGQMEIKKVIIVSENPDVNTAPLRNYVHQLPGLKNGKRQHLAYDTLKTALTCRDLTTALVNDGFIHANVTSSVYVKPKDVMRRNPKCEVTYFLHPNEAYNLRSLKYEIHDEQIDDLLKEEYTFKLQENSQFSVNNLNEERKSISSFLQNNGYYKFNKDFIRFVADTVADSRDVDVTLVLDAYRANSRSIAGPHPCYRIGNINRLSAGTEKAILRDGVLNENIAFRTGEPYSSAKLQQTYQRFSRLQALRYTNIQFTEREDTINNSEADEKGNVSYINHFLDCDISMSAQKPNSISFQPEGTNTAGDLGAAMSLIYENRNLFHGSETFSIQLRGAYENIRGLEGYNNEDYIEYGIESKLQFPRFIAPFISDTFKRNILSTSELSVAYNSQNRPEFHRRMFSAAWRYKWSEPNHHTNYKLDVLDLNYIYMPWISPKFKHDYLDSVSNRNAILRYNYEDLFIMKIGFGIAYNNGVNAIKANIETAGNLLSGLSHLCSFRRNDNDQYTLFNIAYAQYVKADFDVTHMIKLNTASELVLHGGLGVAYPYGNSNVLPFEKRYFSGGANSVRGWSVRGLGPGSYGGSDGRIDFINQTGDLKLDLNVEYRQFLFWKLYGAAFVDAGNIWTIRNYDAQPGGQFKFDKFLQQLAVAYGLGVRLNFSYFILRFDCGMKAVNPVYDNSREHFPIVNPRLSRDFAFHFAVGLPF